MQTICSSGSLISSADKKALDHYLAVEPKAWAREALTGMITKAIKTIKNEWFTLYKSKQEEGVSADIAVIIPGILAMEEFIPYNSKTPTSFDKVDKHDADEIQRDEDLDVEVWEGGFTIEDHEKAALDAFYVDFEVQLRWFMNNKIYRRKLKFVKEWETILLNDPEVEVIPARHDAFINMVVARDDYKNRVEREAEALM